LGQGTGGGALALAPADRVLCARHAWLSPLPPEGASAIVHRTTERAGELAELQGIGSADLLAAGIVDRIVAERDDAADEPVAFCRRMGEAIARELVALPGTDPAGRLAARNARYRGLGLPGWSARRPESRLVFDGGSSYMHESACPWSTTLPCCRPPATSP